MSNSPPMVTLLLQVIVLAVASAGCSTSAPSPASSASSATPGNGTLHASSVQAGVYVYFDGQYRSTTPAAMYPVSAGPHTL